MRPAWPKGHYAGLKMFWEKNKHDHKLHHTEYKEKYCLIVIIFPFIIL